MLPDLDGFEVCRLIRRDSDVPVIMLTARGEVTHRIVGLELGADDYLPKPFDPHEPVAGILRILKRAGSRNAERRGLCKSAELTIDRERQVVAVQGTQANLTNMEYRLVELLASRPAHPFRGDDILNALRGVEADL